MIPSVGRCFALMQQYGMLENIRAHSIVVAKIARHIASALNTAGIEISVAKTTAGALLHDIGKTESLRTGTDHAALGKRICIRHHLYEIAGMVAEHVVLADHDLDGKYTEKEIVYYADKRVNHDCIVTLDERQAYIIGKYGKSRKDLQEAIMINFQICACVEDKLFRPLAIEPESLAELVRKEILA
jgi:uncharacterized protein